MNTTLDYVNETDLLEDPFTQVDQQQMHALETYFTFFIIVMQILAFVAVLASLSADLFLIVVICRFRKLRSRLNMYILNYCILNFLQLFCVPLLLFIMYMGFGDMSSSVPIFCVALQSEATLLMLCFVFITCLAVDWVISACRPNVIKTYEKYYKFVFLGFYLLFVVECISAVCLCISERIHLGRYIIVTVMYVIALLLLAVVNVLRYKLDLKKGPLKTAYAVTAANVVLFSLFPMFIYHLIIIAKPQGIFLTIILYSQIIPEYIVILHPVLLVYLLGKRSTDFKMAYDMSFKRSVQMYGANNLDEASDDEEGNQTNGVQVGYVHGDGLQETQRVSMTKTNGFYAT